MEAADHSQIQNHGKRGRLRVSIGFVIISLLLGVYIFGLKIWHGAESPFNTIPGKAAFTGIFVGGPVYVFFRFSRQVGWLLLGVSIFLWLFGLPVLTGLVSLLAVC